jgi:uncharacterized 2Fe-2S/4Fe-4S cluster protein (DUF4445 family)
MVGIIFNGEQLEAQIGETLFAVADRAAHGSHEIASSCHRTGSCRECLVQIKSGNDALSPWSEAEAFLRHQSDAEDQIFRLACQARVIRSDLVIEVETFKRRLEIAVDGQPAPDGLDPWVRREDGHVCCDGVRLARHAGPLYGIAIDVGTTTVVLHAVDLETGRTLAVRAFENLQKYGGSDVMHRISYDATHPGQLHRTIIAQVNDALRGLPIRRNGIFAVTVAGNPTMRDLFFGLDVQTIGQRPFVSQTQADLLAGRRETTAIWSDGKALGLAVHPRARVYGLPLVSNHVGADMAAVLATIPVERHAEPFMVIDIGTNTEVAVGNRERIICASCPAGPAFEGGRVSCGTAACDGAITALRWCGQAWDIARIGTASVRGVCGSGLVDLLAELRANGAMDALGRFRDGEMQIPIWRDPPLALRRSDASELAQAKAANAVGQVVLCRKFGIEASRIGAYYLAGAFANTMNLENARRIGLLLPVPDERIIRIGNASVEGAKGALLSNRCLRRIETLVRRVEHVELEQEPDFFDLFAGMTLLDPLRASGPSE